MLLAGSTLHGIGGNFNEELECWLHGLRHFADQNVIQCRCFRESQCILKQLAERILLARSRRRLCLGSFWLVGPERILLAQSRRRLCLDPEYACCLCEHVVGSGKDTFGEIAQMQEVAITLGCAGLKLFGAERVREERTKSI